MIISFNHFEVFGVESRNAGEGAVGDDGTRVRIAIGKISPFMYGKARSGNRSVAETRNPRNPKKIMDSSFRWNDEKNLIIE